MSNAETEYVELKKRIDNSRASFRKRVVKAYFSMSRASAMYSGSHDDDKDSSRSLDFSSWLYLFCARCHGRGDADSWEPAGWRRACPQPFCPSYRKFARILCLLLLGLLIWGITYSVIGDDAKPGGPLFAMAVLAITAHFAGWLVTLANLPALIGMLLTGILMKNLEIVEIDQRYNTVVADLRYDIVY